MNIKISFNVDEKKKVKLFEEIHFSGFKTDIKYGDTTNKYLGLYNLDNISIECGEFTIKYNNKIYRIPVKLIDNMLIVADLKQKKEE